MKISQPVKLWLEYHKLNSKKILPGLMKESFQNFAMKSMTKT